MRADVERRGSQRQSRRAAAVARAVDPIDRARVALRQPVLELAGQRLQPVVAADEIRPLVVGHLERGSACSVCASEVRLGPERICRSTRGCETRMVVLPPTLKAGRPIASKNSSAR